MGVVKPLSPQRFARRKELADVIRGGEFKRGVGKLETPEGSYCCLGVACRVAERHRVKVRQYADDGRLLGGLLSDLQQPNVMRYYGITRVEEKALANMNDALHLNGACRHTWDKIADHIETGDLR